ncbi:MAG: PqqD family peptide modification chaperone [Vicinamibacterales bacterium]|nr:PqqD family peptide modification chaperone [Vicinamibacterales bacterium]
MNPQVRHSVTFSERVGDDTLVYDTVTHTAHRLNATAAAVWRLADGTRSIGALAEALRAEGVIDADETLVLAAVDALEEAGLLTGEPAPEIERLSRRAAIAKVATVALPLVASIVVPTPAEAQSSEAHSPGGGASPTPTPTCSITATANSPSASAAGGTGTIQVTTGSTCDWTASSNATWLTVTPTSGRGNGTVSWSAQTNTSTSSRSAIVSVAVGSAAATITVSQEARSFTQHNGTYAGTTVLRQSSSPCPSGTFVDSYSAETVVNVTSDGKGTIVHRNLAAGTERSYPITYVGWLSDGALEIRTTSQNWVIGANSVTGSMSAVILGNQCKSSESASVSILRCASYFDMTATKK